MKKLLALVLVLLLCVSIAAAAPAFSPRYEAVRLAQAALAEKYGLTPAMYTYFVREVTQTADGWTIRLLPNLPEMKYVCGEYTVQVADGKAAASWTWDGKPVGADWSSEAWGAPQLQMCLNTVRTSFNMGTCCTAARNVTLHFNPNYVFDTELLLPAAQMISLPEGDPAAVPARRWTQPEAEALAREVLQAEFGLSDAQMKAIECTNAEWFEQNAFGWEADFWLTENFEDPVQGKKDGAYILIYDAVNDCVWDVQYDASLSGNG